MLCWKDNRFTIPTVAGGRFAHIKVRTLSAARDGGIWIGTESGLDHLHRETVTHYTTKDGLQSDNIRAVFEDAAGTVWVGTEIEQFKGGLQRMERGLESLSAWKTMARPSPSW